MPDQNSKLEKSSSAFVVEWALTMLIVALFMTFSIWLGLFLGQKFNSPHVFPAASWSGMILFYVLNFFKKDIQKPMLKHLDEALFKESP